MPTFTQTAKYALRWLTGVNVGSDIDAGFQTLAEDIDAKMAGRSSGPLSSRPVSTVGSPGIDGRFYRATDTGQVFLDTGTGWVELTLGGAPASVPTATVLAFGGSSAPAGYLACDGAAVDRTLYAALFTAIGTAHGVGNGTTTFNVPDLRGRVPVGAGTGTGLTNRVLGSKFGEEDHALTTPELAAHTHTNNLATASASIAHSHNIAAGSKAPITPFDWGLVSMVVQVGGGTQVSFVIVSTGTSFSQTGAVDSATAPHTHAITGGVQSAGSGQAHNTVQPSQAVNYVIKT